MYKSYSPLILKAPLEKIFSDRSTNSAVLCAISECLSTPPSLLCNSNNDLFHNSMISANHDKGQGF